MDSFINNARDLVDYLEGRINPYSLNEQQKATVEQLYREYPVDILIDSIEAGIEGYFKYDKNGDLYPDSIDNLVKKLSGIAYNKSLAPIDQKIASLVTMGRSRFAYWDNCRARDYLKDYVAALLHLGWSEEKILEEFDKELRPLFYKCKCWSNWHGTIESWTEQANQQAEINKQIAANKAVENSTKSVKAETFILLAKEHNTAVKQLKAVGKNVGDSMDDVVYILEKYGSETFQLQKVENMLNLLEITDDPEARATGIAGIKDIVSALVACHKAMYRGMNKMQEESTLPAKAMPVGSDTV